MIAFFGEPPNCQQNGLRFRSIAWVKTDMSVPNDALIVGDEHRWMSDCAAVVIIVLDPEPGNLDGVLVVDVLDRERPQVSIFF
jgi:hypothetical protein